MRECGQSIFGGCQGETCERDCSYPRAAWVINLEIEQCQAERNSLVSVGITAFIAALEIVRMETVRLIQKQTFGDVILKRV